MRLSLLLRRWNAGNTPGTGGWPRLRIVTMQRQIEFLTLQQSSLMKLC
jgi:hypothetical protein